MKNVRQWPCSFSERKLHLTQKIAVRDRLSELSLQDNQAEPRPPASQSADIPKVDKPQAVTNQAPFAIMLEKLNPPRIGTVGREIRATAIQVELDQDFFRPLAYSCLWMNVGLRDLDTQAVVDSALKGQKSFRSEQPVPGFSTNGVRVLKFVFFTHSMRVKEEGSYRLFYSVHIPDPRGFVGFKTMTSTGFVTTDCPGFSKYPSVQYAGSYS
jgi:hypothetical protein